MGVLPRVLVVLLAVVVADSFPSDVVGVATSTPTPTSSLLLRRLEMIQARDEEDVVDEATTTASPSQPKPEMYSLKVTSHITHRFANTLIASRLANPANQSQQIFFSVTLPESAFISRFVMEIEGKTYEAYVKEKEAAKQEYDQAVASGQSAAHVALSARDSNRFTVSVNVEPLSKVTFNLTYEELLTRRLGAYNHVINLDPGQVVRDLTVDVYIQESTNITTLRVPELRSGNEVDANELTKPNPLARIERKSATQAHVSFAPTAEQQKALGQVKKQEDEQGAQEGVVKTKEGLGGQFVVQYDVDREQQAGEILVNDGFFVHFFAPKDLAPLSKHALFVLDVSGSMGGRKIEQLKQAMNAILDDLNPGDYFNIIEFSYSVKVWNLDSTAASAVFSPYNAYSYDAPAPNPGPTPAFPATPEYVAKAKDIVAKMRAGGGTNIFDTLKTVIKVAHTGLENITTLGDERREPIIVFLTDGEPTVGETRLGKIFSAVQELNVAPQAAIFSLAFGDDADLGFLKKLSLKNAGFARKIYEASDAALQLRDFYRQIASPLLANVTFNYVPDKVVKDSTTRVNFHTLFSGSELVVAGKLARLPGSNPANHDSLNGEIVSISATGASSIPIFRPAPIDFIPDAPREQREASSLERLWAYLTIKQLLEEEETNAVEQSGSLGDQLEVEGSANETKTPKQQALELALKYSFVTPLTSLVVVKPNETKSTGVEAINPVDGDNINKFSGNFGAVDRISLSGISLPLLSQSAVQHFSQPIHAQSFGVGFGGQALTAEAMARPGIPLSKNPAYLTTPRITIAGGDQQIASLEEKDVVFEEAMAEEQDSATTSAAIEQTTLAPRPQEPVLISIGDLDWLRLALNGTEVTLPFGENNTDVRYQLFKKDGSEINAEDVTCKTPEGDERECLHLYECSLSLFKKDVAAYQPFFCSLGNYAGVCCPEIPTRATKILPWDAAFYPLANITQFHTEESKHRPPAPTDPTDLEQPNDPGFYLNAPGSQQGAKIAPLDQGTPLVTPAANAVPYPSQEASVQLGGVTEEAPKEVSAANPVPEASVDSGSQAATAAAEEASVATSTAAVHPVTEQLKDPGLSPVHQISQNVNVSGAPELINEETSALNPGFHPVRDMKTSIVEAHPKPV